MWQAIQALFFVVVVAVLAYYTSRLLGWKATRLTQGRAIRLIEVISLGPRRQACMLAAGDRAFLVGITDQCISKIAEFRLGEICQPEAMETAPDGPRGERDFVARLARLVRGMGEDRK